MANSTPTRVVFICVFPPGANLENEGLGRYFGSLISEAPKINCNFEFLIVTLPWTRKWATSVSANTSFKVETYVPKSLIGFLLILWSLRRNRIVVSREKLKLRVLNKQTMIYNIHLMSAGVLPHSLNSHFIYRLFLPILKFISRTLIYIGRRLLKNEKITYEISSQAKEEKFVFTKEADLRRALFDSGMKNIFNCVVKKYGRDNNVLLTMNNRYEIKNYSKSVMLVPDVIPITQEALFSSSNPRWNIIINEIKNACLNSQNWITFSNSTENAARQVGVVTEGTEIAIIPHASIPPGTVYKEFQTIKGKGLDRQWVDYYWRAGQAKATNQLFKFSSFNQNLRYIIYPTQYRFHKNIEILMEAWWGVMKIHPDYKLVLTLDIDKHPQLNSKLRELGISNSVLFIPRLTDSELIAWQARAKFVLSCSSEEGAMPFAVSESMAVEVPFLIPEIPISREILPKSVLGTSSVGIDSSLLLAQGLVDAIAQRDVILKIQTEWAKVYNRSWNDVWDDWIFVIERISKT